MSAGDEQQEIGEAEAVGETGGKRMRLQMIDGDEGEPEPERDGLARDHADDQPADQARACRRGDAVDSLEAEPRFGERLEAIAASIRSTWARAAISGTTPP